MLLSLRLKDFALIEEVEVSFGPGLCLLTGETGAGKSILVGALQLLLGARAEAEVVRTGAREAVVEGLFRADDEGALAPWFEAAGIPFDGESLIRRTVAAAGGRSAAHINGRLATVLQLKELGAFLVQVHGQHQGGVLLDEEEHRRMLDSRPAVEPASAEVAEIARKLAVVSEHLRLASRDESDRERRIESLRVEVGELSRVGPERGEEADLAVRRNRLAHAEGIAAEADAIQNLLREGECAALRSLSECLRRSRELGRLLPEWEQLAKDIELASSILSSVATAAEETAGGTSRDPESLEKLEARLADLQRLKRKYGPQLDDVVSRWEAASAELAALEALQRDPRALEEEQARLFRDYLDAGRLLSGARAKSARTLASSVERELHQLALEKARFEVGFTPRRVENPGQATAVGLEDVRFLFSANPGQPLKPLAKIASGGELSRTMLALLTASGGGGATPSLVFDEVDAGIGGRPAEAVGRRLRDLAAGRQVLCITHLPQIAAFAHHHLAVAKSVEGARTRVEVTALEGEGRVEEMARMLAGQVITDTARRHARQLLDNASNT